VENYKKSVVCVSSPMRILIYRLMGASTDLIESVWR
jgi:hypothetical protein